MARPGKQRSGSEQIARARWQLWVTTFAILGSITTVLVFVSSGAENALPDFSILPAHTLRISLIGLIVGFGLYALDRERNLRFLGDRLTEEQVESTRLSTRLDYLSQLQRERDTNATLLDGSADGIAVVDSGLRVLRFNAAMQSICGVPDARALGGSAPEILRFASPAGEPLEKEDHPLTRALREGVPLAGLELRLQLPSGEERWVSGTFSPVRDGDGGPPVLVLVTVRDISAQKDVETMQRDFVSIVSHELRSPLTAIKGFTKTLLLRGDRIEAPMRNEFLQTVNDQADRLAGLVEDLLQVSRIDARRLRIERAPVDLQAMLDNLVKQFSSKWSGREIAVVAMDNVVADADARKIEEVLINLIDNAVKYSPPPEPVIVRLRATGDEIEVCVEDRGLGIAPEDAANLFQKFQRIVSPATRDIGGTGLGLYIVKGLIEAHGGHVWVESAPGEGSTFGFTLPVATGAPSEEAVHQVGA